MVTQGHTMTKIVFARTETEFEFLLSAKYKHVAIYLHAAGGVKACAARFCDTTLDPSLSIVCI